MGERLKDIVEELAELTNRGRRDYVEQCLCDMGLPFRREGFPFFYRNLFVDFPGSGEKIVLASHFDRVAHSPGANDNASAVAVLMGVAGQLSSMDLEVPVRLAFFDKEESGLYGSRKHVSKNGVGDVAAVLNLELVGEGSVPLFWPFHDQSDDYKKAAADSVLDLGVRPYSLPVVVGNSGDHESYMRAGVRDSACLTLAKEEDLDDIQYGSFLADQLGRVDNPAQYSDIVVEIVEKVRDSKTLEHYHKPTDDVDNIREESLRLAEKIVLGFVRRYSEVIVGKK